jgi:hypothetical protein
MPARSSNSGPADVSARAHGGNLRPATVSSNTG